MWWNRSESVDVLPAEDPPLSDQGDAPELFSVPPTDGDEVDREAVVAKTPKRDVNARFFFVSLAVLALFLVGVHFLHAYQMQRISSVFLTSAQKAAEADEPADSIRYLSQYLNFHPRDLEGRILLADQLAWIADTPSPAKSYHLVEAHLALEEPAEARRAYQQALAEGFSPRKLHPLEQSAAETLKQRVR